MPSTPVPIGPRDAAAAATPIGDVTDAVGTAARIPPHLRQYVAVHDPAAYSEVDQAVWRFILLQAWSRLVESAHPAYAEGLARTGIGVERIPNIEAMDRCLGDFGWGAVCVDGFIPPRAFQEFQALGILTIAGAIRSQEHLAYTPAPDIVHEAAGHAPILPEPEYRAYLQRFGAIGACAFSAPRDRALHDLIYELSERKEDPDAGAAQIAVLEGTLQSLQEDGSAPSEAALLSRLHWWTVEYGLVGHLDDYRLYGAGLLSSPGESASCHSPTVRKLPLSPRCLEFAYDITRAQPQLFVARDFAHLHDVLESVAEGLAQRHGGLAGLHAALESEEVATLGLDSGAQVIGRLRRMRAAEAYAGAEPAWLEIDGPAAVAFQDGMLAGCGPGDLPAGVAFPLGRLADGSHPEALDAEALRRRGVAAAGDALVLRFASGIELRGAFVDAHRAAGGRLLALELDGARARLGEERLGLPEVARALVPLGSYVASAAAGSVDAGYWPATAFGAVRVPRRRAHSAREQALEELYREALRLWSTPDAPGLVDGFARIAEALRKDHPDDWLLRWNLLECLRKADHGLVLACELRDELLALETGLAGDASTRAPIRAGLRFLGLEPHAPAAAGPPGATP